MNKKKITKLIGLSGSLAALAIGVAYTAYVKEHTFTLSDNGTVKREQIQPVNGKIRFIGSDSTDVSFTDVESGKKYTVKHRIAGKETTVQLEQDRWYRVSGGGELIISSVNVRMK